MASLTLILSAKQSLNQSLQSFSFLSFSTCSGNFIDLANSGFYDGIVSPIASRHAGGNQTERK